MIIIDGSTLVQNNTFVDNNEFDGLLRINAEYGEVIIDHNDVYNNKIYFVIVFIDASNVSITISDNNFTDNYATAVILRVSDSMVTINDSYFYGNRGTDWYGNEAVAIGPTPYSPVGWSLNVSVMIAGCTFVHNYPPRFEHEPFQGAVSLCMNTGPVSIVRSTFIDNLASTIGGGAVRIITKSSVLIDPCIFMMEFRTETILAQVRAESKCA